MLPMKKTLLQLQVDSSMVSGVNSPTGNGKVNLLEMRQLSASQLHLLLHPTDDEDDAELKESTNLVMFCLLSLFLSTVKLQKILIFAENECKLTWVFT
jgi:hypothetical protein